MHGVQKCGRGAVVRVGVHGHVMVARVKRAFCVGASRYALRIV